MSTSDRPATLSWAKTVLRLPARERHKIAHWAATAYPHEACGVLLGKSSASSVRVRLAVEGRNLNTDRARDRYELDPADLLRAEDEARSRGLDVVGIWHSHPDHPAQPSETDRASAWTGWSYLIASVDPGGVSSVRSWRLVNDEFFEEEVRP